jgi:mRNA interferase MazF
VVKAGVNEVKEQAKNAWAPERGEVIWIDCSPQVGREMRDRHPFAVLSPRRFNERTSLVIGLPMTTAAYNAGNPFAVLAGKASGRQKRSYILCHQPKSFDWRLRAAAPHPMKKLPNPVLAEVCQRLNQIIQLG